MDLGRAKKREQTTVTTESHRVFIFVRGIRVGHRITAVGTHNSRLTTDAHATSRPYTTICTECETTVKTVMDMVTMYRCTRSESMRGKQTVQLQVPTTPFTDFV